VLTQFYNVPARKPALTCSFALATFSARSALGRFFDTLGRRKMISGTYACPLSAGITAFLFSHNAISSVVRPCLTVISFSPRQRPVQPT